MINVAVFSHTAVESSCEEPVHWSVVMSPKPTIEIETGDYGHSKPMNWCNGVLV